MYQKLITFVAMLVLSFVAMLSFPAPANAHADYWYQGNDAAVVWADDSSGKFWDNECDGHAVTMTLVLRNGNTRFYRNTLGCNGNPVNFNPVANIWIAELCEELPGEDACTKSIHYASSDSDG